MDRSDAGSAFTAIGPLNLCIHPVIDAFGRFTSALAASLSESWRFSRELDALDRHFKMAADRKRRARKWAKR
jgi:hypothetical protein